MNYITIANVQDYLGVTLTQNGQATFNLMLPMMQDLVDSYCNRTWNFTNPVTETFNAFALGTAPYLRDTFFPKYPISPTPYNPTYALAGGIQSVTLGGQACDLNYVYNYKTHFKVTGFLGFMTLSNPLGYKAVQVVYTSDDAGNPPTPLKLALIEWMARKIKNAPDAGKEVVRVDAGAVRVHYKPESATGIPDFVKVVLDQYTLPVVDRF